MLNPLSNSPLGAAKEYDEPSVFTPDSLLTEARRQKDLPEEPVPEVCVLDPDGDIVRFLVKTGNATKFTAWPGYHTDLYECDWNGKQFGTIGCAVGAAFAVLVAEQLFAAGCQFLISVTSSGQIKTREDPPYFVLIDRALRDEGTSHHYQQPGQYARIDTNLRNHVEHQCEHVSRPVYTGATWTTDAPFRETPSAINRARSEGILAVEMEAAALYTLATVRDLPIVCFAHVTNQMGQADEDFEKGPNWGSEDALEVISAAIRGWDELNNT